MLRIDCVKHRGTTSPSRPLPPTPCTFCKLDALEWLQIDFVKMMKKGDPTGVHREAAKVGQVGRWSYNTCPIFYFIERGQGIGAF